MPHKPCSEYLCPLTLSHFLHNSRKHPHFIPLYGTNIIHISFRCKFFVHNISIILRKKQKNTPPEKEGAGLKARRGEVVD